MSDQDTKQESGQADPAQQEAKPLFSIGSRQYDVDAAVKKITSADSHIEGLEKETQTYKQRIQELEEKLKGQGDLDSKLDEALQKLGQAQNTQTQQPAGTTTQADYEELRKQILSEAAKIAVDSTQQYEQGKIRDLNMSKNIEAAKRRFGDQYEAKLREEGQALGYDDTVIQKLAEGSPEVFNRLFGLTQKPKDSTVAPNSDLVRRAQDYQKKEPLPDPTKAFDSSSRVTLMQQRLNAKMKEKGLI